MARLSKQLRCNEGLFAATQRTFDSGGTRYTTTPVPFRAPQHTRTLEDEPEARGRGYVFPGKKRQAVYVVPVLFDPDEKPKKDLNLLKCTVALVRRQTAYIN